MDKYVIDLDKVLDELELNDNYDETNKNNNFHLNTTNAATSTINQFPSSFHSMSDPIDLNDADFSIQSKPPKLLTPIAIASSSSLLSTSTTNNASKTTGNSEESSELNTSVEQSNENNNNIVISKNVDDINIKNQNTPGNESHNHNTESSLNEELSVIERSANDNDDNVDINDVIEPKIVDSEAVDENMNDHMDENISSNQSSQNDTLDKLQDPAIIDDKQNCDKNKGNLVAESNDSTVETIEIKEINETEKVVDSSDMMIENKNQNDLDEKTIGAMSEEDLDKHLNDLNDDLENLAQNTVDHIHQANTSMDIKKLENEEIIKQAESLIADKNGSDPMINHVETVDQTGPSNCNENEDHDHDNDEYWSKKLGLNENDENEQAKQLQELEEILANSDRQPQQQQSQPEQPSQESQQQPVTESTVEVDNNDRTRGGLVQNINYFERQEMPNGLTEEEQMLGKVKPFWIPDEDAQNCLHCDAKFTLIKRRHHCRSCGKVLCSQCCNFKARLPYLDNKETRVCQLCYAILMKIEQIERISGRQLEIPNSNNSTVNNASNSIPEHPDPNNPSEYCSTISPLEQVSEAVNLPPPTVMVPVGVLKRPGSNVNNRRSNNSPESSNNESTTTATVKQVMFSDGVRPGGDLVEQPVASSSTSTIDTLQKSVMTRTQLQLKSPLAEKILVPFENFSKRIKFSRVVVTDPSTGQSLPSIINYNELKSANSSLPSKPNYGQLIEILRDPQAPWITFGLTKNLHINTKIVSKTCCNNQECWSFSSKGLASVGQDEVVCLVDCQSLRNNSLNDGQIDNASNAKHNKSDNKIDKSDYEFPRDVLRMYTTLYDSASTANLYTDLMHIFFADGLFNNKENSGFIFTRPTIQCLRNIHLPSPPFLIAILIHRWEIPWAKIFPLRLVLRLGYEYKMYPSPVISYANRKSSYFEIGHTIMNVLADFRNYHYTLSVVKDLFICVEERKRVTMYVPKLSYEKVCKVLSTSNEHVLAFGGNFCTRADSHFVCVQNERDDDIHSQYRTELSMRPGSQGKLTGASFIVFSGVLKSTTGLKAKMNIVEDGLLVQIPPSLMEEFRSALKDMKDFRIDCCKINDTNTEPDEWIHLKWVNDDLSTNLGVRSQIDGMNLEGVQSAKIFSNPDYANERYLIRWIEVFLLKINDNGRRSEMINANKLAESVAQAFCVALIDYLDQLYESGLTKISLRISLDIDKVGYETGSGGKPLPPQITQSLDNALIPVIMGNISTTGIEDPLIIELLFFVLLK